MRTCGDQFGIRQPRADALVDLVQQQIAGHDRRQLVDVAVVDDLEELFLRPARGILGAKVVQHQQLRRADLVKALLEGRILAVVGGAQRVEQVRNRQEERRHTHADRKVRGRGRQVRLAASGTALQEQPAVQILGVVPGLVVGHLQRVGLLLRRCPAGRGA